jgi:hypothetical protein
MPPQVTLARCSCTYNLCYPQFVDLSGGTGQCTPSCSAPFLLVSLTATSGSEAMQHILQVLCTVICALLAVLLLLLILYHSACRTPSPCNPCFTTCTRCDHRSPQQTCRCSHDTSHYNPNLCG